MGFSRLLKRAPVLSCTFILLHISDLMSKMVSRRLKQSNPGLRLKKVLTLMWGFTHSAVLWCALFRRKSKTDTPKTPTTPTSPMSPSFSSAGGPLPPHLATGDSVRDKCIDMLAAALRTAGEAQITLTYRRGCALNTSAMSRTYTS